MESDARIDSRGQEESWGADGGVEDSLVPTSGVWQYHSVERAVCPGSLYFM